MGLALSVVLYALYRGRYCGLGTNLINASLSGETVYAWDWALKLALTVLTLAAGFQGGEVTPLFSIGASLGAVLAGVFACPCRCAPRSATPPSSDPRATRSWHRRSSVRRSSAGPERPPSSSPAPPPMW